MCIKLLLGGGGGEGGKREMESQLLQYTHPDSIAKQPSLSQNLLHCM